MTLVRTYKDIMDDLQYDQPRVRKSHLSLSLSLSIYIYNYIYYINESGGFGTIKFDLLRVLLIF